MFINYANRTARFGHRDIDTPQIRTESIYSTMVVLQKQPHRRPPSGCANFPNVDRKLDIAIIQHCLYGCVIPIAHNMTLGSNFVFLEPRRRYLRIYLILRSSVLSVSIDTFRLSKLRRNAVQDTRHLLRSRGSRYVFKN